MTESAKGWINAQGDFIPQVKLEGRALQRFNFLSRIEYPRDEKLIFHLSPRDFKDWLYLQDPKKALLFCSTYGMSERINRQLSKNAFVQFTDFLWRMFN